MSQQHAGLAPTRESQVNYQLNLLNLTIEELATNREKLVGRLESVLLLENDRDGKKEAESESLCSLAYSLKMLSEKIRKLNLSDVLQRLQL